MFTLTLDTDNAAFDGKFQRRAEIRRILRDVVARVARGETEGRIMDVNGNGVGRYELTEE